MIIPPETLPKHIEILRNSKQQGSLAIFVGCGVSCATNNTKYKSWGQLIDQLKNDLNSEENDFLKVAQLYFLEFGSRQIKKKVKSFFPEIDEPGEIQKAIINLRPHYIITTNWDCLIDNAIDDNPGLIDKIATDKELVQSDKDKKYLKIHGDFAHDNFVFTEDDYLNYSYNFPLIENFIKSILSTHVVLLLGYSFSDWDLKQIVSWIRHNSKERPPIYMVERIGYSNVTAKYYDNLGIQILPTYNCYADFESKVLDLLNSINNKKLNPLGNEPEKYIYSVLQPYENYPVILQDMIAKTLTNSSIIFDSNNRAILELNINIETKDKNEDLRKIFQQFCDNVDSYVKSSNENYRRIISILKKADIHGFATDNDIFNKNKYFNLDETEVEVYNYENKEINFDFKCEDTESKSLVKQLQIVFDLYYDKQFEKSFSAIKQLIKKSRQERNYFVTFIALFNYNLVLQQLKFSFSIGPEISKKYRPLEFVNLENEYDSLPEIEKAIVKPLYNFLNFSFLYRESFISTGNLAKVRKRKSIIAHGGLSFSSEVPGYLSKLKNLIEFVLNNYILFEEYHEYRNLCESYLLLNIENTFDKEILFGKIELYTSIKCFNNKDLKEFYDIFYKEKTPEKSLNVDEYVINWLIDEVFRNCIDSFIKSSYTIINSGEFCQNCLFMLSLLKLSKEQTDRILQLSIELISKGNNSQGIFENINSFIGIQYNVFKNENIDGALVLSILETLLLKFVSGKINGDEKYILTQYSIYNIFGLSHIKKAYFTNKELLTKVILSIKTGSINDQIIWVQHVLIPIYQLSDENCKKLIKSYVTDSDLNNESAEPELRLDFYIMKLLFVATKIEKSNTNIIPEIKSILESYSPNIFSSKFIILQNMVNAVCKSEKDFDEFKSYLDDFIKQRRKLLPFENTKEDK